MRIGLSAWGARSSSLASSSLSISPAIPAKAESAYSLRSLQGRRAIPIEDNFNVVASYVALAIEVGAVLVVALGASQAIIAVVGAIFSGTADELRGREIWLKFATWILLALEFALAADIVRTAVAPTWEDIWKLAVIAVIRTMLNYFLAKDIADFSRLQESGQIPSSKPVQT